MKRIKGEPNNKIILLTLHPNAVKMAVGRHTSNTNSCFYFQNIAIINIAVILYINNVFYHTYNLTYLQADGRLKFYNYIWNEVG